MKRNKSWSNTRGVLGGCLLGLAIVLPAHREAAAATPQSSTQRELIFGSELMSDAELDFYRSTMEKLRSEEERRAYRERHRERLRLRARDRGVELDEPAGVIRRRDMR